MTERSQSLYNCLKEAVSLYNGSTVQHNFTTCGIPLELTQKRAVLWYSGLHVNILVTFFTTSGVSVEL